MLYPFIQHKTHYCKECKCALSTWIGDGGVRRRAYKKLGLLYLDIFTDYVCENKDCEKGKIELKIQEYQIKVYDRYCRFIYYKRHKKKFKREN